MKVSHNSTDLLIIDHIPWILATALACMVVLFAAIGLMPLGFVDDPMVWLYSFMFTVVGGGLWLLMLEMFARRLQFIFDRQTDRITIRRRSLFRREEQTHKLSRLIEARIETDTTENGTATYRPVVILRAARGGKPAEIRVPLHHYFTSGTGPETVCDAINSWQAGSGTG